MDTQRARAISMVIWGRYDDALTAIDRAIEQNNHLLALYFERAEYAIHQGDADAATAAYFASWRWTPIMSKPVCGCVNCRAKLRESDARHAYCLEVHRALRPHGQTVGITWGESIFCRVILNAQESFHRCTSLQIVQNVPVEQRRF